MPWNHPSRRRAPRLGRSSTLVASLGVASLLASGLVAMTAGQSATASASVRSSASHSPGNGPHLDWSSTAAVAPVHVVPAGAVPIGAVPATAAIKADVELAARHPGELEALASAVSTPGSPMRGRYLRPSQLLSEFSPSPADVSMVEAGLAELGLHVDGVSADRLTVTVNGPASTFARAMRTNFERYRLRSGRVAYANTTQARLPMPLGSAVSSVVGLDDLATIRPLHVWPTRQTSSSTGSGTPSTSRTAKGTSGSAGGTTSGTTSGTTDGTTTGSGPRPCASAKGERDAGGLTANQLATYYRMTGLYDKGDLGAGVTVGIVEFERNSTADIAEYEACYGISTPVQYVKVDGGSTGFSYGTGEAALDIEDVAGLAPDVHVVVYQAPNSSRGVLDEFQHIVDHPTAQVVTNSWGECEQTLASSKAAAVKAAKAESTLFEYAAAEGQTWLSAAGDEGSTDCYGDANLPYRVQQGLAVDDPGSQPYMTSVGGTALHVATHRESVWNEGGVASGGGISVVWPMPAYQQAAAPQLHVISSQSTGSPCGTVGEDCREVPDVTADGDPITGYVIYYQGGWATIGGTSAAAPLWAAVTALVDASPRCGGHPVGFLNPTLYALGGSANAATDLTDITSGNNDDLASGYAGGLYRAGVGYDMASGLGSPVVTAPGGGLASALCVMASRVQPGIDTLSPASGPASGGNSVTVYGYGFSGVTGVDFGGVPALSFRIGQDTTGHPTWIAATVPPGRGTVRVTVISSHGTSTNTPGAEYTYRT